MKLEKRNSFRLEVTDESLNLETGPEDQWNWRFSTDRHWLRKKISRVLRWIVRIAKKSDSDDDSE